VYKLKGKSANKQTLDKDASWFFNKEVSSSKWQTREKKRILENGANIFRFADYEEKIINMVQRLITVSLRDTRDIK
jgi:hypothetical protein